ncbi:MAG: hypothetical protein N2644_00165 [Candidatus Sumerlaea chitinivorans]|nr:hypothetical protein [Candidatus Sumerlaea chitinivorans]
MVPECAQEHPDNRRHRSSELRVLILASLAIVLLSFAVPLRGWWTGDCGLRYLILHNIVDRHPWQGFWLEYPLRHLDPEYEFRPFLIIQTFVHKGQLFAQYPPWFCYLSAPFYALAGRMGMRFVTVVAGLLLLYGAYKLAKYVGVRRPSWAASVVVFGTPVLPYIYTFWDVIPALAAAVWATYFALRVVEGHSKTDWMWAALAFFFAFLMREEYLLWTACVWAALLPSVFLRRGWRPFLAMVVCAGAAMASVMLANRALVGHYLFFHASTGSGVAPEFSWSLSSRLNTAFYYLARIEAPQLNPLAINDLLKFSYLCTLALIPHTNGKTAIALLVLGTLGAVLVRTHLWAPGNPVTTQWVANSLSAATSLVFVGLYLWRPAFWRWQMTEHLRACALAAGSVLFLAATVCLSVPGSETKLNFGPRLLLSIYHGLIIAVFALLPGWLDRMPTPTMRQVAGTLVAVLVGIGCIDSAVFLSRLRWKVNLSNHFSEVVSAIAPQAPILTDMWYIATDPAELFYARHLLSLEAASDSARQQRLMEICKQLNPTEALLLISKDSPPPWLTNYGDLFPVNLEKEFHMFGVRMPCYAFILRYRNESPTSLQHVEPAHAQTAPPS